MGKLTDAFRTCLKNNKNISFGEFVGKACFFAHLKQPDGRREVEEPQRDPLETHLVAAEVTIDVAGLESEREIFFYLYIPGNKHAIS